LATKSRDGRINVNLQLGDAMDIPLSDDSFFKPAELNICIFPHLREFMVVDSRATVRGGPHTYLLDTDQVLDSDFYSKVEASISEIIRDTPRTFSELGYLPQRMDDAIRENVLSAIFRQVSSQAQTDDLPEVSIFLCVGPALGMSSAQINETVQAMLGERADSWTIKDSLAQLERLMGEERVLAKAEETELTLQAISGNNEMYYTLWSRLGAAEEADGETAADPPSQDHRTDENPS
jgi:hypothetical protein